MLTNETLYIVYCKVLPENMYLFVITTGWMFLRRCVDRLKTQADDEV